LGIAEAVSGRVATTKSRRIKASHRRRWKRTAAYREYQHTDALGSPVATTNSSKTVLQRSEYEPYGYLLNRVMEDGPGYTGHVTDAATGLVYMQQRYYDPELGVFPTTDPVTPFSAGGAFNRYWYANANPYRLVDPDGRQAQTNQNCGEQRCPETPRERPDPPKGCGTTRTCVFDGQKWKTALGSSDLYLTLQGLLAPKGKERMIRGDLTLTTWRGATHSQIMLMKKLDRLGKAVGGIGLALSGYDIYAGYRDGNGGRFTSGVVGGAFGAAGIWGGPAGAVGSLTYGGTSMLMDSKSVGDPFLAWLLDTHEAAVQESVDTACSMSGNC